MAVVCCCSGGVAYSNLMHDKRVVRGSTFAAHPLAQVSQHHSTTRLTRYTSTNTCINNYTRFHDITTRLILSTLM